ncbi:hypothetical protein [Legionella fallonii]|nr:hypothetical protein [Legionella fallonii]
MLLDLFKFQAQQKSGFAFLNILADKINTMGDAPSTEDINPQVFDLT